MGKLYTVAAGNIMKLADLFVLLSARISRSSSDLVVDLPSRSVSHNRRIWDNYDWSHKGEEWTRDANNYKGMDPELWKSTLIKEMMMKYVKHGSSILEIGPGAGRWTDILSELASRLVLADISQACIDICKERFKSKENIEYYLIKDRLDMLENASIDVIWSYDVFVHINPSDIQEYVKEFRRILASGGIGIIHHAGNYESEVRKGGFRAYMNKQLFAQLVSKTGMKMVEQNEKLPHCPGDVISVFTLP